MEGMRVLRVEGMLNSQLGRCERMARDVRLTTVPRGQRVPKVFAEVLTRLCTESVAHFGTAGAQLVPVSYEDRPFSHLLRVAVWRRAADQPDGHLYIKIFKAKPVDDGVEKMRVRVAHDFEVSRRVCDAMAGWTDFSVVRPIACYIEHLALVTEQADGETLTAFLESRARWFPSASTRQQMVETLSSIGGWVRAFQSIDVANDQVSLGDLRAYVDVRLQRLTAHNVFSAALSQRILDYLDALAANVPSSQLADVLIHADLAPGNILVSGRRIVLLDLAMVQRGSRLHDISRLYLQLDVLCAKPQFRPYVIEALQNGLLRGFDETLTRTNPLFRYLLMLHRVNHLGTLALNAEPFPASALSHRVRRIHLRWIERELQNGVRA
jgi:hypothetical protein